MRISKLKLLLMSVIVGIAILNSAQSADIDVLYYAKLRAWNRYDQQSQDTSDAHYQAHQEAWAAEQAYEEALVARGQYDQHKNKSMDEQQYANKPQNIKVSRSPVAQESNKCIKKVDLLEPWRKKREAIIQAMKLDGSYDRAMICADKAFEIVVVRYNMHKWIGIGMRDWSLKKVGKSYTPEKFIKSKQSEQRDFIYTLIEDCSPNSPVFNDPNDTVKLDIFLNQGTRYGIRGSLSNPQEFIAYYPYHLDALSKFQEINVPEQEERVRISRGKNPEKYKQSACTLM